MLLSELRWLFTALLLLVIYRSAFRQNLSLLWGSRRSVTALAILGQVLFPLTLYIGLQYTSSLNAAVYMSATPCVVLTINRLVFRDRITSSNVVGVLISTLGVIYLLFKGNLLDLERVSASVNRGDLWAIGSALSWALYCSFLRVKDGRISGYAFVTASSIIGALIMLPICALFYLFASDSTLGQDLTSLFSRVDVTAGLIYLVLFPSWLSYLFWNRGIMALGATKGEIFTHVIPLSGGLMSILFLNVEVGMYHLVSALCILGGIYLCSIKKARVEK